VDDFCCAHGGNLVVISGIVRRFMSAGQGIGRHQAHLFGHPQRDKHPV
jgi:hypothetical protein